MDGHIAGARVQRSRYQIPTAPDQRSRAAHPGDPAAVSHAKFRIPFLVDGKRIPALAGRIPSSQDDLIMELWRGGPDVGIERQGSIQPEQTGRVADAGEGAHLSELLAHSQTAVHLGGNRNFDESGTFRMLIAMDDANDLRVHTLNGFSAHHEAYGVTAADGDAIAIAEQPPV